ncbi:MAG: glycosyltransferase [Pseudomonadota bacterium]
MSDRPAAAPALGIVIAARNMEDFIGETLDSIAHQTLQSLEVVVVNDGSTDATAAIVASAAEGDPRIRLISGPGNGVSAARNRGLAEIAAPLVLFLDADDLLGAGACERLVAALDGAPKAIAAIGCICRIREDGALMDPDRPAPKFPAKPGLEALLRKNFIVNGGSICMRTSAVRRIGGFDTRLKFAEDWEMWCRLCLEGGLVTLENLVALYYRQRARGANYTARIDPYARRIEALDIIAENPDLRRRLGGERLLKLLRDYRIDTFWSGVRNEFTLGSRLKALRIAALGAVMYPDSVMRPQLILRFVRSLLPQPRTAS